MTKEESDLIIENLNESRDELLKAIAKFKADYHELCSLKDMRIAKLEAQIEKMKCCENCKHNYNEDQFIISNFCDDCFDCSKWEIK